MSVSDWQELGRAAAAIFIWLYGWAEWLAFGLFYPGLLWLWRLTPFDWPVWSKVLVGYAFPLGLMVVGQRLWNRRHRGEGKLGRARWATLKEIDADGMLKPHGRFLGAFQPSSWWGRSRERRYLYMHGEGHCLTIAAQGAGKTTGLIIPTLCTYVSPANPSAGSVVVTDPKGAITAQMLGYRSGTWGKSAVALNPWRQELLNDPGFAVDLGDNGFNPLQQVSVTEEGRSAAKLVASLVLPDFPGTDPFWRESARELLEWCMLWQSVIIADPDERTLTRLHGLVYDQPELLKLLKAIAEDKNTKGPGRDALRRGAASLYGGFKDSPATFAGMLSTAKTALSIYDADTYLGRHVSAKNGFRLSDLKGRNPITVFIICPPTHLVGDDRKWLNLTLAMIAQEVGKPGIAREVLFLIDEFPALGYLPNLAPALEQFREAGLRAHLIAQNPGQILQVYGKDGLERFWGACETKQFFRMTDPNHAKMISEWLGQVEVVIQARNAKGEINENLVGVPLVRPDELTSMPPGRQIIIRPNMRPILGDVVPYFKGEWIWNEITGPNPYRDPSVRGKDLRPVARTIDDLDDDTREVMGLPRKTPPEPSAPPSNADAELVPDAGPPPAPDAVRAAAGTMVVDEAARKTPEEVAAEAIKAVQEERPAPKRRGRPPKNKGQEATR